MNDVLVTFVRWVWWGRPGYGLRAGPRGCHGGRHHVVHPIGDVGATRRRRRAGRAFVGALAAHVGGHATVPVVGHGQSSAQGRPPPPGLPSPPRALDHDGAPVADVRPGPFQLLSGAFAVESKFEIQKKNPSKEDRSIPAQVEKLFPLRIRSICQFYSRTFDKHAYIRGDFNARREGKMHFISKYKETPPKSFQAFIIFIKI